MTTARRFYSDLAHKYSKTVLLPKTPFPKRSNLEKVQKDLIPRSSQQLYKDQLNSKPLSNDSDLFILHDGPPYANGDLHLGHALNKILKDIINRYNLLLGKQVYYKPGWDCHGLPIELKALEKISKKLKKDPSTVLSVGEVRKLAREHAETTIKSQLEGFKSLAILTDFEDNYKTLNHHFEINQLKVFQALLKRGLIKRQKKPVYWGCQTHTALAEGELEYNDNHKSITLHLKFPIVEPSEQLSELLKANGIKELQALIWTSTPWTIPSNRAISINDSFEYAVLKNTQTDEHVIVSHELSSTVLNLNPDFESTTIIIPGSTLLSSKYTNPLITDTRFPIIHGDHVTNTAGTGLVHTAPGHGNDDYFVCLANGIDVYSPVDQFGKFTDELPEGVFQQLKGLFVLGKGTEEILKIIGDSGMVYSRDDNYIHSYPYDWRSKKPIIIRATPQWFTNVGEIKEASLKALEEVEFIPERGRNRLSAFIRNRNEWCISRQRSWGVPIPALYGKNDENHVVMDEESVRYIISKIEELGTDAWFEEENDIERWLPEKYRGQGKDLVKGKDTMDVWFDSGSSWNEIREFLEKHQITNRETLADVYLEGSDQHRGWFQSSILTKIGIASPEEENAKAPYKKIVTHGFTLDEKGLKMSKSIGNVLTPESIIKGQGKALPGVGVDGLRIWVAQSDYTSDMSMGPNVLKHVGDALKKLRITFTFLLGNLNDLKSADDFVPFDKLNKIDQFALSRLAHVNDEVLSHYAEYNFNRALKTLTNHLNIELSAIYFDIIKDRLYTDAVDSRSRRAAQTVLYHIFQSYLSLLSPIIPVMTQEVWDYAPEWVKTDKSNPILNGVVDLQRFKNVELEAEFENVWELRDEITLLIEKGRKEEKTIKNSLETEVYITVAESGKLHSLLKSLESELSDYYLISKIHINQAVPSSAKFSYDNTNKAITIGGEGVKITVVNASDAKCPRCWRYSSVSEEELCGRCEDVVSKGHP